MPTFMQYFFESFGDGEKKPEEPLFNVAKYPIVAFNYLGNALTLFSDPAIVQEIYTTHANNVDKTGWQNEFFAPMFKDAFGTLPTNDTWRVQRKQIAHMFFNERLAMMVDVFKEHLKISCDKWEQQIK